MIEPYQRYEVTVKFEFESEVFAGDPDDVYELAELEKDSVRTIIENSFEGVSVTELKVDPLT